MKVKLIIISIILLLVIVFACGCIPFMEKIGLINPTNEEQLSPEKTSSDGLVKVLIGFKEKPGLSQQAMVKGVGGKIKYTYNIVDAIAASIPEKAIEALQKNPNVRYVEPDGQVYALDAELDNTWGVKRIGAGFVHDDGNKGAEVKIAIIDSGVDYLHEDLDDNFDDNSLLGYGYDFVNDDDDPMDDNGHGTHVAGTVAAEKNGDGVVGVAPAADLYALKVLDETGRGYVSDIVAAIEWCADNYIHVTNNSYGSSGDPGETFKDAFDNAYASGVLHVAAAGNSGNPPGRGDNVGYPAAYDSVIAVAASDINDKRASFSSTGSDVELIAPGVGVLSTWKGNSYYEASGTSMASPHVAGSAALAWAANPGLTNVQIREALRETAEDLGLSSDHQGYGLVRADLAVRAVSGIEPPATYTIVATVGTGGTIDPSGDVTVYEGDDITFTITADTGYEISDVIVDGVSAGAVGSYSFVDVTADYTIHADFTEITEELKKMHVNSIEMWDKAAGRNRFVYTKVGIVSFDFTPVSGATVYLKTALPDGSEVFGSGNTADDGTITFETKSRQTGTYTSTVTNVEKDGWTYDSEANIETSDSIEVE